MGLRKTITEPNDSQPVTVTKEHQLQLRLFSRTDAFKGTPPDCALFRELLSTAHVTGTAHHVACLIYDRMDRAGILEVGVKVLAADAGISEKTVRRALPVLQKACVVRRSRAGKGKPYVYRINCGGMDWPMVKERAKHDRAELGMPETDPEPAGGGADSVTAPGPETDVLGRLRCGLSDRTSADSVPAHSATVGPKGPTTSAREAGRSADPSASLPAAPGRPSPPSRFRRKGPASPSQRAYARKLGVTLPEDATNDSANEAIQSAKERKGQGFIPADSSGNSTTDTGRRMAKRANAKRTQAQCLNDAAIKWEDTPPQERKCDRCGLDDVGTCHPVAVDNDTGGIDRLWTCEGCE